MEDPTGVPLGERLRAALVERARRGESVTYRELTAELGIRPPLSIHRLSIALDALMAEDAAAGRPLLAALCISRLGHGLPTRGFFIEVAALGVFSGDPDGPEARVFHAGELRRLREFYRQPPLDD